MSNSTTTFSLFDRETPKKKGAEVELHFRTFEEGGRREPVLLDRGTYRPHFVVSGGEYLGIAVTQGPPEPVQPGGTALVTVAFIYEPAINYSILTKGTSFDVMEGSRVVASGRILRLL